MRVLLSGATGFLGSALATRLRNDGAEVVPLARTPRADPHVSWNPDDPASPTPAAVAGFDAVVHLAGANIAAGRWSAARKEILRRSRVDATRRLAAALVNCGAPPAVFVGPGVANLPVSGELQRRIVDLQVVQILAPQNRHFHQIDTCETRGPTRHHIMVVLRKRDALLAVDRQCLKLRSRRAIVRRDRDLVFVQIGRAHV